MMDLAMVRKNEPHSASRKPKPFVHHRTLLPRHPHFPPKKGKKCNPCVRYDLLPMFRVAHKRTSTRGIAGIVVEFFVLGRSHDARNSPLRWLHCSGDRAPSVLLLEHWLVESGCRREQFSAKRTPGPLETRKRSSILRHQSCTGASRSTRRPQDRREFQRRGREETSRGSWMRLKVA